MQKSKFISIVRHLLPRCVNPSPRTIKFKLIHPFQFSVKLNRIGPILPIITEVPLHRAVCEQPVAIHFALAITI